MSQRPMGLMLVTLVLVASTFGCTPDVEFNGKGLQLQVQALQAQIETMSGENTSLKAEIATLKQENDNLRHQIAPLERRSQLLAEGLTVQHLKEAEVVWGLPLDQLTQEQVLLRFIMALQKGDGPALISLYSKRFGAGVAYPQITPRTIKNISIAPFSDNPEQIIFEFEMLEDGMPFWVGHHCFFPRFVFEDSRWKIDALPTSP